MNVIYNIYKTFTSLFRASYSTVSVIVLTVSFISTIIGGLLAKSNSSNDLQAQLARYFDNKVCEIAAQLKVNYKLCKTDAEKENEYKVFWNRIRGIY